MLSGRPIDAVLFDMDGVLVDVSGSFRRVVQEVVRSYTGVTPTKAEIQAYKDRGGFNDDWKLSHTMLREAGHAVPFEEVVAAFQRIYLGEHHETGVFDGLIAEEPALMPTGVLAGLAARYPLALVTGRPERDAQWTLARFGWDGFFPSVVGMDQQAGRGKPDPYGIELAMEQLDALHGRPFNRTRSVYVGDNGDDMRAASAAGLLAIGVVPPYLDYHAHRATLMEAGADVVISRVADVPMLLPRKEAGSALVVG
ncbi:MAG: HAD family hydrolase [Bacteroidota bacterium]